MPRANKYIVLLILLLSAINFQAKGQNTFATVDSMALYSTTNELINGEEWVYVKKYAGHPFYHENEWMVSDIVYKGILFQNENVKYNINTQELIVFRNLNEQARIFTLNKQYLSSFTLFNKAQNRTLLFEYNTALTGKAESIYTKVYSGKTSFYIQYKKEINKVVKDQYTGEYLFKARMFIRHNNSISPIDSKSQMLTLLGDHKNEIKKFMRSQGIKFDRKFPENLIPVFEYYDSLNQ